MPSFPSRIKSSTEDQDMPQNDKALFRKTLGGFRKKDVNSYIESLNRKFTAELGSEKELVDEMTGKLRTAENEIEEITNRADSLFGELSECREKLGEADSRAKQFEDRSAEDRSEIERLNAEIADLRGKLAEANDEIEALKRSAEESGAGRDLCADARAEAAVILAGAKRKAGLLNIRSQRQQDEIRKALADEMEKIVSEYVTESDRRHNEIFTSLSVEYKKLYTGDALDQEKLVRKSAEMSGEAVDRIMKTLDSATFDPDSDDSYG